MKSKLMRASGGLRYELKDYPLAAWASIPPKKNRTNLIDFSLDLYRSRNPVERFFNRIKRRRIATRYDKLAANYLAFMKLASIRLWIRACEATP